MDNAITQFLSKGTLIIAVTVVIVQFFIRRSLEIAWPSLKPQAQELDHKAMYANKVALWWNSIGLYLLPVLVGGTFGWLVKNPMIYGEDVKTVAGRIFYAALVGWFADFLYEVLRVSLYKATGVSLPDPGTQMPLKGPPSV